MIWREDCPVHFPTNHEYAVLGHPGTAAYLNDVTIVGHSTHELEERIGSVLQRMQEYGFKLRREKCQFFPT